LETEGGDTVGTCPAVRHAMQKKAIKKRWWGGMIRSSWGSDQKVRHETLLKEEKEGHMK